jgi:ADP-ribose pyrophosphatase YjhB (NUDIX family)
VTTKGKQTPDAFRHEVLAVTLQVLDHRLCVLVWRRGEPPHRRRWALPGGSLLPEERLGTSIARHLAEKVDVRTIAHLEQLETRSDPRRDPRGRVLATAYVGVVPADATPAVPADTAWHPVDALPTMAFDHGSIVASGVARLRAKLSYTNVAFALAPPEFTVAELRQLYVAALGHDVSATNLKRVLTRRSLIRQVGDRAAPGPTGGRPAALYRFTSAALEVTDPGAVFRAGSRSSE